MIKVLRYGASDVQESFEVSPFGDDANPVKDMIAVYSSTSEKGQSVIIGYFNKNRLADVGEKRIFSTDEDGNLSTYAWLKNDGTMEIGGNSDFMVRFSELQSAFNELRSDLNSLVTQYNAHIHVAVDSVTSAPITVSPTVAQGTPSTADISGAKINEIKTL